MNNLDINKNVDEVKIVKYDNSFNKTSLSFLSEVQSDILMAVLQKMGKSITQDDYGNTYCIAKFEFKEIRDLIGSKNMYAYRIKNVFDNLLKTQVEFEISQDRYKKANLFSSYTVVSKSSVEIILSAEMTNIILVEKNFTILELDEYVSLKHKYSKELYRLLRQFRHSGMLIIKKSDLLEILKPPKSYDEYEFIRKSLRPAIENNSNFFEDLKLINLEGKGNSLPDVCKFTFKKHKKLKDVKDLEREFQKAISKEELELLEYIANNGGLRR